MTTAGYTDIDIKFLKQKDGDIRLLEDIDAVNANIYNIVMTMQGSRRMMPYFSYNAYNLLFENMTDATAQRLGHVIKEAISNWEDRINLTNVNVDRNLDNNCYVVTASYSLKGFGPTMTQTLTFILQRL